jgi:hypothetical protein
MSLQIVDGPTIQAGESLSDAADCSAGDIVRFTIPQEFTDANLTFQISSDGNFFNDLYNVQGEEVTIPAKPDCAIVIRGEIWGKAVNFIKIRSGTRQYPVKQVNTCKMAIAIWVPTDPIAE